MTSIFLYLALWRDIIIGIVNLAFGRLMPKLHVPEQDLSGKVAFVTGANSGIGYSISRQLAAMGATVYLACRNTEKAEAAATEIRDELKSTSYGKKFVADVKVVKLDASSFDSVRSLISSLPAGLKIDLLYHNAGMPGMTNTFTSGGEEITYQTNFLSSFLLTFLLENHDHLSANARVIFTTSTGHYGGSLSPTFLVKSVPGSDERGYHFPEYMQSAIPSTHYSNTKLMQVCAARLLQDRFSANGSKRSAHVFTPAYCSTPIFTKVENPSALADPTFWLLDILAAIAVPVEEGAATGIMLATRQFAPGEKGSYWDRCVRRISLADRLPQERLDRLWVRWCNDCGIEWK